VPDALQVGPVVLLFYCSLHLSDFAQRPWKNLERAGKSARAVKLATARRMGKSANQIFFRARTEARESA
jgi:hypothetical protein